MKNQDYDTLIKKAVNDFWETRKVQKGVLAGKQLDSFIALLRKVAKESGVPNECIHEKNGHVPGYFRATKEWDMVITTPKGNLAAAIELKSQVGSYENNPNNRVEESIGSAEDFWTAFREKSFTSTQTPWLGYFIVVGDDETSRHPVKVNNPLFSARREFDGASYLDRYTILCQRLVLEHKYNAVALLATTDKAHYRSLAESISVISFLQSFKGYLSGIKDEF